MKKSDFYVVGVIYAITIFFLVMTLQLPEPAQTYPLILLSALFFLNTLYLAAQARKWVAERRVHNDIPEIFEGFQAAQFFTVLAGILCYLALMWLIGYYASSIVYLAAALTLLRVKKVYSAVVIVVMTAVIYAVFSTFLRVPLPVGVIFS